MNLFLNFRLRRQFACALVLFTTLAFTPRTDAFALLGPYADWMTITNGYHHPNDIGGPMDLGAGYRWNVPVVTYAFDQSFVDAFGTNGIVAVEGAVAILNNLPPASQLDPSNFLLNTMQVNFSAAADGLIDLKSTTLSLLLEQLGLAQPTRFTSALHDFSVSGNVITGNFLKRNFDPFSFAPTNAVNGTQYGYTLYSNNGTPLFVDWYNFPIDPFSPDFMAVADKSWSSGSFFSGLTRDDAGGLRYLLQTNNYNFENLLPDVHGTGTNAVNYVNLALRGGVDKVTFVRQDYNYLTGVALTAVTNDFVDSYLTNGTVVRQQLERVISKPDFIFSAFDTGNSGLDYIRTGTTNWVNNSALNGSPGGEGPGIIRSGIVITFPKYGFTAAVTTGDIPPYDQPVSVSTQLASFDNSTNAPIVFPTESAQSQVTNLQVNLFLDDTTFNLIARRIFTWNLPIGYGAGATLQTSTNLEDWFSQLTITNYGSPLDWNHVCTLPRDFFRVIPATNAP